MALLVLSAGRDAGLLKTRNEILARNGCDVVSAGSSPEVINRFFDGDYDLMILCHSLPLEERRRLLRMAKHYRPSMTVISVKSHHEFRMGEANDPFELRIPPEPEALVRAVNSVFPRLSRTA